MLEKKEMIEKFNIYAQNLKNRIWLCMYAKDYSIGKVTK